MNERHLRLCASSEWAATVRDEILPWALGDRSLGEAALEIGPGPGLTTDILRRRTQHLTAVEIDSALAVGLSKRLAGTNVAVLQADATALPFRSQQFSGATSFTMLHHVPSVAAQDTLLAEVRRVLRPGAVLVGVDSLDRPEFRALHDGDICVPVDPDTLANRLRQAGFIDVEVELKASDDEPPRRFRFAARAPGGDINV